LDNYTAGQNRRGLIPLEIFSLGQRMSYPVA
jgi:hypothetical protein